MSDINIGDFLEIRGAADPSNSSGLIASRLERDDPEPDDRLRGVVVSVSRPVIVILGVDIETGGAQFRDDNDQQLTADEFFGRLNAGDVIQVDGAWDGNRLIADEVEFETDN